MSLTPISCKSFSTCRKATEFKLNTSGLVRLLLRLCIAKSSHGHVQTGTEA